MGEMILRAAATWGPPGYGWRLWSALYNAKAMPVYGMMPPGYSTLVRAWMMYAPGGRYAPVDPTRMEGVR